MAKFQGELKILPISSLHENPHNIRDGYDPDKVEFIAGEIKQFGILQPLNVYPHPDIEGDYMIRDGNHRYLAALKIQKSDIPCIVSPATKRDGVADVDAMMSTGLSHTPLNQTGVSNGIQRYLDLGLDITTIGKKRKMPRTEVQARARLAGQPRVAALHERGVIDLLTAADLFKAEDETGDGSLFESAVSDLESSRWSQSQQDVTRLIEQKKANAKRDAMRSELTAQGAVEIDSNSRYSGKWSKSDSVLSVDEHVSAGHQFDVSTPDSVHWWEKSRGATKSKMSEEQKAEKELVRRLTGTLPQSKVARQKFVVSKIRDKKALIEAEDRELFASVIFESDDLRDEKRRLIAEVISLEFPEPEGDESEYGEALRSRRTAWEDKAYELVFALSLGQQVRLYAWIQAAVAEDMSHKFNLFQRTSWETEARWKPMATWYKRLISFFGYVPDRDEVEAMRLAAKQSDRKMNVELPVGAEVVCAGCGQHQVIAADDSVPCPTCDAEATE